MGLMEKIDREQDQNHCPIPLYPDLSCAVEVLAEVREI